MPGIIDDPGSFAGKSNAPKPDLGPEAKNRMSFIIFWIETARILRLKEKLTNGSCVAIEENLFLAGLYLFIVILLRNLQKVLSKFFGALIPEPTAVPPWGI